MARKTRQSKLSAFKSRYRPSAKALAKKRTQTGPRSKSFKRDYDNSGNKAALPPEIVAKAKELNINISQAAKDGVLRAIQKEIEIKSLLN